MVKQWRINLPITVHPKNDKVDSLCDILQVPNDAPLAWLESDEESLDIREERVGRYQIY